MSQEVSLVYYQMRLKMNQGINNLMITLLSRKYPFSGVSLKGTQIPKLQLTFLRSPTPAQVPSWHFPYCSMMRDSDRMVMCFSGETALGRNAYSSLLTVQWAQTSNGEEMRKQLPGEGSVFQKALGCWASPYHTSEGISQL